MKNTINKIDLKCLGICEIRFKWCVPLLLDNHNTTDNKNRIHEYFKNQVKSMYSLLYCKQNILIESHEHSSQTTVHIPILASLTSYSMRFKRSIRS